MLPTGVLGSSLSVLTNPGHEGKTMVFVTLRQGKKKEYPFPVPSPSPNPNCNTKS